VLYWPEIYSNIPFAKLDVETPFPEQPDPKLFGNVSPFDPQQFQSGWECGDALLEGKATGKYSPIEVAQWLEDLANASGGALDEARRQLGSAAKQPEFRRVEEDVLILCAMAQFFAGKLRTAVLWRVFEKTGERAAAEKAIAVYGKAIEIWTVMAERAKSVYMPDITYGRSWTRGHWIDRIPLFEEDLADLKQRLEEAVPPKDDAKADAARRAIALATGKPTRPTVRTRHTPAGKFHSGQPLAVALECEGAASKNATLHYRHVNQAERWQSVEMKRNGDRFEGAIPGEYTSKRYPLQYYFEVATGPAEATLVPRLAADLSNFPYYVVRRA
jgi:hypothetical protein